MCVGESVWSNSSPDPDDPSVTLNDRRLGVMSRHVVEPADRDVANGGVISMVVVVVEASGKRVSALGF